jgi:hypothetical protein
MIPKCAHPPLHASCVVAGTSPPRIHAFQVFGSYFPK